MPKLIDLNLSNQHRNDIMFFFNALEKNPNLLFYFQRIILSGQMAMLGQSHYSSLSHSLAQYLNRKLIQFFRKEVIDVYNDNRLKSIFLSTGVFSFRIDKVEQIEENPSNLFEFIKLKKNDSHFWLVLEKFILQLIINDYNEENIFKTIKDVILLAYYHNNLNKYRLTTLTECYHCVGKDLVDLIDGEKRNNEFSKKYSTLIEWVDQNVNKLNFNHPLNIALYMGIICLALLLTKLPLNFLAPFVALSMGFTLFMYKREINNMKIQIRELFNELSNICSFELKPYKKYIQVNYPKRKAQTSSYGKMNKALSEQVQPLSNKDEPIQRIHEKIKTRPPQQVRQYVEEEIKVNNEIEWPSGITYCEGKINSNVVPLTNYPNMFVHYGLNESDFADINPSLGKLANKRFHKIVMENPQIVRGRGAQGIIHMKQKKSVKNVHGVTMFTNIKAKAKGTELGDARIYAQCEDVTVTTNVNGKESKSTKTLIDFTAIEFKSHKYRK